MRFCRSLLPVLLAAAALSLGACSASQTRSAAAADAPIYVHMNGANDFLEPVVVAQPGQPVVFVNEDTGTHTVIGYDPQNGTLDPQIDGTLAGTPGPGAPVPTYTVRLTKPGIYAYYCSVHAVLAKTYGKQVQPAHKAGVHGFAGSMAGWIVVSDDTALQAQNPPTSKQKVLADFFGG